MALSLNKIPAEYDPRIKRHPSTYLKVSDRRTAITPQFKVWDDTLSAWKRESVGCSSRCVECGSENCRKSHFEGECDTLVRDGNFRKVYWYRRQKQKVDPLCI